jgi:hypothetical protein
MFDDFINILLDFTQKIRLHNLLAQKIRLHIVWLKKFRIHIFGSTNTFTYFWLKTLRLHNFWVGHPGVKNMTFGGSGNYVVAMPPISDPPKKLCHGPGLGL